MGAEELLGLVSELEPRAETRDDADRPAVRVPVDALESFLRKLRDGAELAFDFLLTHTAVDWTEENRFELVYLLYSTIHGHHLMVTADIPRDEPVAPTVSHLWPIAEWQEREAYDLFGILYDNHPDLRRVFLEDDWQGFPLRKDYRDEYMLERPKCP
jgi:NADH-quinone oxidoreductase subunit C